MVGGIILPICAFNSRGGGFEFFGPGMGGEGSIPVPLPPPACPKSCVLRAILLAIEASSQRTRCVASQQKGSLARERRLEVSKDLPTKQVLVLPLVVAS